MPTKEAGFQEADTARLRHLHFIENDLEIFGDLSLLRMSLEILLHVLARDPLPQDITIRAKAWDGQAWSCDIQVNPAWDHAMWTAIERCMQGVLRASAMSCSVKHENEGIVISYFERREMM